MINHFLIQVVELKLGGKDIPVTSANRIAYIHLVADYRLNKQIRQHCLAFRQGLANVVNLEWLRMFDQQEIQVCNFMWGLYISIQINIAYYTHKHVNDIRTRDLSADVERNKKKTLWFNYLIDLKCSYLWKSD